VGYPLGLYLAIGCPLGLIEEDKTDKKNPRSRLRNNVKRG
jgi:hypothetical protein